MKKPTENSTEARAWRGFMEAAMTTIPHDIEGTASAAKSADKALKEFQQRFTAETRSKKRGMIL